MGPEIWKRKIGIILMPAKEEKHIKETKKMIRNPWLSWNHPAEELFEKLNISIRVQRVLSNRFDGLQEVEDDDDRTEEIRVVSECYGERKEESIRFCEDGLVGKELDSTVDSGAADHVFWFKTSPHVPIQVSQESRHGVHQFIAKWVQEQPIGEVGVSQWLQGTSDKCAQTSDISDQNL